MSTGTTSTVTVTINGTNDAATISADSQSITEDDAALLATGGLITVTDVDAGEAFAQPQTNTAGTYGTFNIDANGNWTYEADNTQAAIQQLGATDSLTETFTVLSQDGTASNTVTVTINGADDPSDITIEIGDSASEFVTEDQSVNSAVELTTSGTLTVNDVDGDGAFNTSPSFTSSTGNGGAQLGVLTIDASGNWSYAVDNSNPAVQNLDLGDSIVETYTVSTQDGNDTQTITITINGADESLLVAVNDSNAITEDATPNFVAGTVLTNDFDPDGDPVTVVEVQGATANLGNSISGVYGSIVINGDGSYTYTLDNSLPTVQALADGQSETENFTYTIDDGFGNQGTASVVISVSGTNDAATVSSDVQVLAETDALVSTSGTLTSTDIDNTDNAFTATSVTGTIGDFSIDANGNWTFTANSAFDSLNVGDSVNETFNVTSVDGTPSTVQITINGTNDAATVSSDAQTLTETDAPVSTSGTLTSTDVDNVDNAFTATTVTGTIGDFSINAAGNWTFTANSAFDNLNVGDSVNETFNVTSVDGTPSTVQITINGTNDAATVSSDSQTLTETDAAVSTSGTLTSTDVDNLDNTFTATTVTGAIGDFNIDANGNWTFTANSAFDSLNVGDSVNETFNVTSVDGTPSTVQITINGTNDAATVSSDAQTLTETDAPRIHFRYLNPAPMLII